MNKGEKIICVVLGLILAFYLWNETRNAKLRAEAMAAAATNVVETTQQNPSGEQLPVAAAPATEASATSGGRVAETIKLPAVPAAPEQTVVLSNEQMAVTLTTWGAGVKSATFFAYGEKPGELGENNPAVRFDFGMAPAGGVSGSEVWTIAEQSADMVAFKAGALTRRIRLERDYRLVVQDAGFGEYAVNVGAMPMDNSKNGLLSIDSYSVSPVARECEAKHWYEEEPLKGYLVGGLSGGCGGSSDASGLPVTQTVQVPGAQKYLAVKNRFFVSAIAESRREIASFAADITRDPQSAKFQLKRVNAVAKFAAAEGENEFTLYLGPKKQSLLWDLGMKDVMDFGMWRWLCYPLVWVLNFFHGWIPNFGVAIILLTILVRILFWPLTHKSTVGMRKMQEVQPLMKEIQAKYKDNPQRLQQETWKLYREHKVNPMSSCLPMLIQIPVFIALFNVLRSAVELRYAPFLWIADLSEPEALFASWFPFGGLNLLPIAMAVTTGLQSAFTPSVGGDKSQQRMMMVFMPVMMLVMFYSFPSALSLYWFLSNLFSIVQMWMIRRHTAVAK